MRPHHVAVLTALETWTLPQGEMCMGFSPIAAESGINDVRTVRRIVRHLARKGYAEYHRGLCTEDGDFAGAGYCITRAGIEALDSLAGSPPAQSFVRGE